MWRFKPSKFKNSIPKVPKKGDGWILDISVGFPLSHGNLIKASSEFIAFNIDKGGGGSLGVLPVNTVGSQNKQLPILNAHSELITDFDFCPYDDGIIATGSQDKHVKVWRIPEGGISEKSLNNPEVDLLADRRIEVITFNPVADCLLATTDDKCIRLWDVCTQKQLYVDSSHDDIIQSISWNADGSWLASCGKDKKLRIWDPRNTEKSLVSHCHSNNRDVRVIWIGSNQVLTSGFGSGREREVILRDIRNIDEQLASYSGHSSMGVFIPLFDEDTNMLFLVSKADTTIVFCEILDKAPHILEASKFVGDSQIKGAALVPKRAMNVMEGEVNRLLVLGPDCIVPISYQVPRKSYRDFHADLFVDTRAPEPALSSVQWQASYDFKIKTISLDPSKRSSKLLRKLNHILGSGECKDSVKNITADSEIITESVVQEPAQNKEIASFVRSSMEQYGQSLDTMKQCAQSDLILSSKPVPPPKKPTLIPKPSSTLLTSELVNGSEICSPATGHKQETPGKLCHDVLKVPANTELLQEHGQQSKSDSSPSPRRPARTFGMRVSKFRHLNGAVLPKETHITVLSSLTRTIPGESDGFCANNENVAVPLGVAGGLVAVLKLSNTGRAPSLADVPGVVCGTAVMDFAWDPFDSHRLVTVCDTGDILVWNVQNLTEKLSEPMCVLRGHFEKINTVKFNPCAKDIISTASNDLSVRIWDLLSKEEKFTLEGHSDQILCIGWSFDGKFLCTVCKDQKVRIYDPRVSSFPIQEGAGPQGSRGARVVWVLGDTHIVVSGFSKASERQMYLYDVTNISSPIGVCGLDVSPATLIPYYEEGSSTLFLTGKGDSTVFAYEVATDSPYFHPLSHYKCSGPHQSLSFLHKCFCSIKDVEFAKAVRLTTNSIEPMSFSVPRLRSEYFQDDLFPAARVTWKPTVSSIEWLSSLDYCSLYINLQPTDMIPLSEAPPPNKGSGISPSPAGNKSDIIFEGEVVLEGSLSFLQNSKEKEEMIVQSMMSQCQFQQNSLPQESFEGVDPEEWEEEGTAS